MTDQYATLIDAARAKKFGTLHKLENYFAEYDFNFKEMRKKAGLRILEIGVEGGGSLAMWNAYFIDPVIIGVDINPASQKYTHDNVSVRIGDQEDTEFLRSLSDEPYDIIIDDGGHTMRQQIKTFETLFPKLKDGGVYVIEDIHTSYWAAFGGKKNRSYTAMGMLKRFIDEMHQWAIQHPRRSQLARFKHHFGLEKRPGTTNMLQNDIRSIYIAKSICFIHKGRTEPYKSMKF